MGLSNSSLEKFFIKNNVKYYITFDDGFDLNQPIDYLVKSPSIPLYDPLIVAAKSNDIKVISDLELFYLLYPDNYYLAVSGTNGKTSVINNLHQLLSYANILHYYIGNMGNPIFDIVTTEEIKNTIILIECSSYMLEATTSFKPDIYIITNLTNHHLDHHLTRKKYFNSKLDVISRIEQGLIICQSNYNLIKNKVKYKNVKIFKINIQDIIKKEHLIINNLKFNINSLSDYPLFDQKNLLTAFIAFYYITKTRNIKKDYYPIFDYLNHLKKYPYRFEKIVNLDQLVVINDSKSTNIAAGLSAIKEMNRKFNNYFLIIGGKEQHQTFRKLKKYLGKVKTLYVYGENKDLIYSKLKKTVKIKIFNTLSEVVDDIFLNEKQEKIILFSPMSASFDQFKNFEERGEFFNKLIKNKLLN